MIEMLMMITTPDDLFNDDRKQYCTTLIGIGSNYYTVAVSNTSWNNHSMRIR